jgi:hypothetical protein
MSDPALIGALHHDGTVVARQIQWAPPHGVVASLRTIWATTFRRDLASTREAVMSHDWAVLCPACTHRHASAGELIVPGVGHALVHAEPALHTHLDAPTPSGAWPQWMYLIDEPADQVLVYEATVHHRWLLHSRHRFDPDSTPAVLACGGHRTDGHRWQPAHVTLLGSRALTQASYPADVCAGTHPRGFAVARFTQDVADQIATHSQAATAPWGPPLPQLRRHGTEFDLVWPNARIRVTRDQDGQLLVGAHLLPWQQAPADRPHEH